MANEMKKWQNCNEHYECVMLLERLTNRYIDEPTAVTDENKWTISDEFGTRCLIGEVVDRLAAYEDSGLTPEDCAAYAKAEKEKRIVVFESYEHMKEVQQLAKAQAEGRLVRLRSKTEMGVVHNQTNAKYVSNAKLKKEEVMNKIQFRAWYPEKSKMYEVAKVDMWGDPDQATCDLASTDEELFDIYLNEVEPLQYIGVKDKYGREICEGDIIQTYFSFSPGDAGYGVPQKPFVVKREQGRPWFRAYKPNTKDWHLLDIIDFFEMQSSFYEVIGNIYENPELLG